MRLSSIVAVVANVVTVVWLASLWAGVQSPGPTVAPPDLGYLCVNPVTDIDLTRCYGLDPWDELVAVTQFLQ